MPSGPGLFPAFCLHRQADDDLAGIGGGVEGKEKFCCVKWAPEDAPAEQKTPELQVREVRFWHAAAASELLLWSWQRPSFCFVDSRFEATKGAGLAVWSMGVPTCY